MKISKLNIEGDLQLRCTNEWMKSALNSRTSISSKQIGIALNQRKKTDDQKAKKI